MSGKGLVNLTGSRKLNLISFLLPLVLLCSCATFKALPQQSIDCLDAQATAETAAAVANCIASNSYTTGTEACLQALGIRKLWSVAVCEGVAIVSDINHARQVAAVAGTDTLSVQANAQALLVAHGVTVQVAAAQTNPQ